MTLPFRISKLIPRKPFTNYIRAEHRPKKLGVTQIGLTLVLVVFGLTGCLEQVQSPRSATGALSNFYLHLYAGELDDARTYMAPGLVEMTPELDRKIQSASEQLRLFEIDKQKGAEKDLSNNQREVTVPGRVRPRLELQSPGTTQDTEWVQTDILTATMVERGPGWRILEFELKCCAPVLP